MTGKYANTRDYLERITREATGGGNVQFPDLFSRLTFLCQARDINKSIAYRVQQCRANANKTARRQMNPSGTDLALDIKALALFTAALLNVTPPDELQNIYKNIPDQPTKPPALEKIHRARVIVTRKTPNYLLVLDEERPTENPIQVACNVKDLNTEFNATINNTREGSRLNLIDSTVKNNILYPSIIILEPDFLIDISAIAECFKEHGTNPLNYLKNSFKTRENTAPLLLGNAINIIFDEICREQNNTTSRDECNRKIFQAAPLDLAACNGIDTSFFHEISTQYNNLRNIITNELPNLGIQREKALVEPSFACENLGIQGRLDFLQPDNHVIIELKSGNPPFPHRDITRVSPNHRVQALLYQAIIQNTTGLPLEKLYTYILYSRVTAPGASLRFIQPSMTEIRAILDTRNQIVAAERDIANDNTGNASRNYIERITVENLVANTNNDNFTKRYIIPSIEQFQHPFTSASPLEKAYFHAFHAFIAREQFLAKVGYTTDQHHRGSASCWKASITEKQEKGEIITGLRVTRDDSANPAAPSITFRLPQGNDDDCPPNFREGDNIIFYEHDDSDDNNHARQLFRGTVEHLSNTNITIRAKTAQREKISTRQRGPHAIEHDAFNTANPARGSLYTFLKADKSRRDLLLNQRPPTVNTARELARTRGNNDLDRVIRKAKQANDYFILVGPPGTGKTSIALKEMVEEFLADGLDILLLSYTNRAVDEICEALENLSSRPPYIRVGPELSCHEKYRHRLLDRVTATCNTRQQISDTLRHHHRVFVSTTASLATKNTLFLLKHFHVAIIDEASQILEPQIIGILSARDAAGNTAIDKFILVGDHKQLPAIVIQSPEESAIHDDVLARAGLLNRRESLFERLLRANKNNTAIVDALDKQGRMHPAISHFPARAFYGGKLHPVPVPHQQEKLPTRLAIHDAGNTLEHLVATTRLAFIPSERDNSSRSIKQNHDEARVIAALIDAYRVLQDKNHPGNHEISIGIITPYRNQIALVRREINRLDTSLDITIDTIERFQGSQRDVIIYSCCVNEPSQMEFLSNTIIEDGITIDRKLNVALTRPREQLFITGNTAILSLDPIYKQLIAFIREHGTIISHFPRVNG
jgi:superfamily II DNA or RNA helicase